MKTTTDRIALAIAKFTPPALPEKPAFSRLCRNLIDRMRWRICGLIGVKETDLTDEHVAQFAKKILGDYVYMSATFPGAGFTTIEETAQWVTATLGFDAGRCSNVHPTGGRCRLLLGHLGQHSIGGEGSK